MNKANKKLLITNISILLIVTGFMMCSGTIFNMWTQSRFHVKPLIKEVIVVKTENLYTNHYNEGDYIGSMIIPALQKELPIYQGTNLATLDKGVGHFIQSVLPGERDNSVFSAHRETAFAGIGNLVIGDKIVLTTVAGTFTYTVSTTRIVKDDDLTVIVPTSTPTITLITCYPFKPFATTNERYIVSANLIISK